MTSHQAKPNADQTTKPTGQRSQPVVGRRRVDRAPTETASDRLAVKTPLPSAVDRPDLRAAPHCVEVSADDDLERARSPSAAAAGTGGVFCRLVTRLALHSRLIPGTEESYEIEHARVWPELIVVMRNAGIREWSIWRSGRDLFHLVECDDYEAANRWTSAGSST